MTLRDKVALGMPLPHRSPDPLAIASLTAEQTSPPLHQKDG
jgi:hypothetical protein